MNKDNSDAGASQHEKNLEFLQRQKMNVKFNLDGTVYKPIENIGTGAYGVVCSALNTSTGAQVAIKKIPQAFHNPTVTKRTLRELKILRHFDHENIVAIKDMLYREGGQLGNDVYIVLDLMESDLHQIIHSKQPLSNQHVQYFLYQILRGLKYIHSANIIHRDLKPSNLMVNSDCLLKIGDFGMARSLNDPASSNSQYMTQYVATRWYRAPELLFSLLDYTSAVDIWSVGCIFAEMISRRQLFPGKDHLSQLKLIVHYLGTPPGDVMKRISSEIVRRIITGMGPKKALPWGKILPNATTNAIDLIGLMMQITPWQRITAAEALKHAYVEEYYDPPNEPDCPVFTFDKNLDPMSKEQLQEEILREIDSIHDSSVKSLSGSSSSVSLRSVVKPSVDHLNADVEMLSAKFEEVSVTTSVGAEKGKPTDSDSKAKLRAALLNAMRNKEAAGSCCEPESTEDKGAKAAVTAAQARYLERLEKRKRRQERREEKTRKSRDKNTLSEQDQSLLDRWSQMHSKKTENKSGGEVPFDYFSGDTSYYQPAHMVSTDGYQQGSFQPAFNNPLQPAMVTFVVGDSANEAIVHKPADNVFMSYRTAPTGNLLGYRQFESPSGDLPSSLNTPQMESQLGDIISEMLPSANSDSLSGGVKETRSISSAQLMEDWLAASSLKPEDFRDLEQEIGI